MRAEEVRNTGAYASGKQITLLIGSGDMCQPLSSRNKKGNVPGQRVGWNLYTLAEPDPRVRLCVPWGRNESDTTERLNFLSFMPLLGMITQRKGLM